ncbi:MAG: GNAT family N-acetyltransferase [Porphyromonadaceae bacterium]|nr:GNAT family N-acetyltransferase [Porphyromonadaceae bacterium]
MILSQGSMMQLSSEHIREEAQGLWELCFGDSPEFVTFYFRKVFKPEEAYIARTAEGEAIAHMHAKRYPFSLGYSSQDLLEGFYVSGACTHPEHRGQGVMHDLMIETMRREAAQGRVLAFLIPADEDLRIYYRKHFGFETNNYLYTTHSIELACTTSEPTDMRASKANSAIDFLYQTEHERLSPGIKRAQTDWANICFEYKMSPQADIKVYRESSTQSILSCALIRHAEDVLFVDGVFGETMYRHKLLGQIQAEYHDCKLSITIEQTASDQVEAKPRAMIRPLRFDVFLAEYQKLHLEEELRFSLVDDILPENTGDYCLANGVISFTSGSSEYPKMTIPKFIERFIPRYEMRFLHE